MTHTPHELMEEFPSYAGLIHSLKDKDAYFARPADAYHAVNREIHRIETRIEAASDEREQRLRRVRMSLKDEIALILAKESAKVS